MLYFIIRRSDTDAKGYVTTLRYRCIPVLNICIVPHNEIMQLSRRTPCPIKTLNPADLPS